MNGEIMVLGVLQQSSTPSNPKTGYDLVYTKSDGLYTLSDAGGETKIGPGAVDIAATVHAADEKTTPVDLDEFALVDSATSYTLKKTLWSDIKATLKTYFDGIYSTGSGYVKTNGTTPLSADWDVGAYKITANQLASDVAAGTAPLVVASDTVVSNLNADLLDGNHAAAFQAAGSYAAATHYHAGTDITSSTIDGDRLPAISTTKAGAVPATGTPTGLFLKDDGNWSALTGGGDVTGPGSSAADNIVAFNGTSGKVIKDSGYAVVTTCTASQIPGLNTNGHIVDQMLKDYIGNRVENNGAEIDTTGWATYADAAGATPVNGTGGSPTCTWTRTTSSPLSGAASFLFTKDASNRQGEGASYDFTIDAQDQAHLLGIHFSYYVASGTYAASDMTVYVYDVTNSALITPKAIAIQTTARIMDFDATFLAVSNSTSYRLIFHVASTSANAYTVKFDNVVVYKPFIEPVYAHYYNNSGQNIGTWDRVTWPSVVEDTHSAMSTGAGGTGEYTIPLPGLYFISSVIAIGTSNTTIITIYKNGAEYKRGNRLAAVTPSGTMVTAVLRLVAGDIIAIHGYGGANLETGTPAVQNWVTITRVGI